MSINRCVSACWVPAILITVLGNARAVTVDAVPPQRDVWYSISDGEQRYGYIHVVARPLDDGNFEFAVTSRMLVEMFEMQQEYTTTTSAIIKPDLTPLRFETSSQQTSGTVKIIGSATEQGYEIAIERDGETTTSTIGADDPLDTVFSVVIGEWLHRLAGELHEMQARDDFARRVRLIAADSGAAMELTIRLVQRDADGSTWTMQPVDHEWSTTTIHLDADGVMREQQVTVPRMHVQRSSQEDAILIEHRAMPDRELLVFPFDRELPPARRLQRVDVQLTWRNISPEAFKLEDSRQKLRSITLVDGLHTAVVSLVRPGEVGVDATLPLPAEAYESTLAESDFIQPNNERIAALAKEIVGDDTSALTAATAICQWVSDYIEPAMIAETLSGSQVLERRTGKCTEYTTLFASLARAAGIPTRVALGQRRFLGAQGDHWGGHMWNEVFVGEWIPVDASANEVGGSLDLLKFIHTDTVMDTQSLRWKLTESLEVSIVDVELVPHAGGDAVQTGLRDGTYTNVDYGFQLDLPHDTWTIEEQTPPGTLLLRLRPPDANLGDSAMFHVTAFSVPPGVSPKMILDARLNQQRPHLNDFQTLLDEAITVRGAKAHRLRFRGVPQGENAVALSVTEVLVVLGESALLLNLIAAESSHDSHLDSFDRILSTFRPIDE